MTTNQRVLRGSENWRGQTHKDPENQRPHWLEKFRFTSCVCVWASSLHWALLFLAICRSQIASTLLVLVAEWLPVSFLPSFPPSLSPSSFSILHPSPTTGFYTEGGGGWNSPPPPTPPEILKLIMGIMLAVCMLVCVIKMLFGHFVPDCIRINLRGCNFEIFLGRGHAPTPP